MIISYIILFLANKLLVNDTKYVFEDKEFNSKVN